MIWKTFSVKNMCLFTVIQCGTISEEYHYSCLLSRLLQGYCYSFIIKPVLILLLRASSTLCRKWNLAGLFVQFMGGLLIFLFSQFSYICSACFLKEPIVSREKEPGLQV